MMEALIGLVGVIVGSAITVLRESWISWREEKREGAFSAIRLVGLLEDYADRCIDVVGDDGTAFGRPAGQTEAGEEFNEPQVETPAPLVFPDDIAWKSIPIPIMHKALGLPNLARITDRKIKLEAEYSGPPDYGPYFRARRRGYAQIGLVALEIVDELNIKYQIPAQFKASIYTDWHPKLYLQEYIAEADKRAGLDE